MIEDNYGYLDEGHSDDYNKGFSDGFNKARSESGLIIKGEKMPKSCVECPCFRHDRWFGQNGYQCNVKLVIFNEPDDNWIFVRRPEWCPLKEV